jgi:hypothetical protein
MAAFCGSCIGLADTFLFIIDAVAKLQFCNSIRLKMRVSRGFSLRNRKNPRKTNRVLRQAQY